MCFCSSGTELHEPEKLRDEALPRPHHHDLWALNLCQIKFLNFPLINGTKRTGGAGSEKVIDPSGLSQSTRGTAVASGLIRQQTSEQEHPLARASINATVRSRHARPAHRNHCLQTSPRAQRSCPPATRPVVQGKKKRKKPYLLFSKLVAILQRHKHSSWFLGVYGIFCSKCFQTDKMREKTRPPKLHKIKHTSLFH